MRGPKSALHVDVVRGGAGLAEDAADDDGASVLRLELLVLVVVLVVDGLLVVLERGAVAIDEDVGAGGVLRDGESAVRQRDEVRGKG